jgi:hypothetical protein
MSSAILRTLPLKKGRLMTSDQPSRTLGTCLFVACALLYASPNLHAAREWSNTPVSRPQAQGKPPKPCNPRRGPCPDTAAPTVTIVEPVTGSIAAGLLTIAGNAADNVGVARVEVQVDSAPFTNATGTTAWQFMLDTTLYADGVHTVTARARDAAGNISPASSISLTINNTGPDPTVLEVQEARLDPPTVHVLGVQVLIAGDANRNGTIGVRYREYGTVQWRQGPPLMRVFPENLSVAVPEQFAGSIFDLVPATTYEIELSAFDSDGPVDERLVLTATTRPIPRTDPATPRLVSVQNSTALRSALSAAQPGDVILLANGIYAGPFQMSASGTGTQPIVIRGISMEGVVIDGGNCQTCNILEISGSYVHVERLSIRNGLRGLRFTGSSATGNVARRLTVTNVVHGAASSGIQSNFYICDNVIDGRLQWPWVFGSNPSSHWDDRGIAVSGNGHVVCHNRIRGFGDPVINTVLQARAWDVYGNDIADAWDGVELDEGEGNVRMFHNRFTNVMAPISMQPIFGGPAYALRNVGFNIPDEQIKLKSLGGVEEPSGALIYHNTFVSPERALNLLSTISQHNFAIGNNLFVGPDSLVGSRTVDWRAGIDRGTFDYNGYFPDGEFMFGTHGPSDALFANFAALQAAGWVARHSVLVTGGVFMDGFVGPADETLRHDAPDFALAISSSALDRGQRLPGINDGFTGAAPDLGALEAGCPVPGYGPRPEGLEHVTSLVNCDGIW